MVAPEREPEPVGVPAGLSPSSDGDETVKSAGPIVNVGVRPWTECADTGLEEAGEFAPDTGYLGVSVPAPSRGGEV